MRFIADDNYVNVIGRTLYYDGVRYMNYSCSSIEFLFTGNRVEAELWTNSSSFESSHKAWIAVFIDDGKEPVNRIAVDHEGQYLLFEEKGDLITAPKEKKLTLVKYSEVAYGKIGIKSIIIDGEQPPRPTLKRERRIEYIGDSITCGYGNEGVWNQDEFDTSTENPWEGYAAITARALNADYHLISWSGIGVISNYTEEDIANDEWLMPAMYPYTDKATDLTLGNEEPKAWEYDTFVPDCIVINLGTNDASYTKNLPDRVEAFGKEYYRFLKYIRSMNPTSVIVCTLGAMGQELCGEIEAQVSMLISEGEQHIHYMEFDVQLEEDGIGVDWHPSKITHSKMADKLEKRLREIMNW